jgi:hypothetical protein
MPLAMAVLLLVADLVGSPLRLELGQVMRAVESDIR